MSIFRAGGEICFHGGLLPRAQHHERHGRLPQAQCVARVSLRHRFQQRLVHREILCGGAKAEIDEAHGAILCGVCCLQYIAWVNIPRPLGTPFKGGQGTEL